LQVGKDEDLPVRLGIGQIHIERAVGD
jgi:hypothetical protein